MATTTNYSWDTPDDTDLVKDGAAAIRTLGSSIDTTTKALNPSTTLGDIEYRSSTANTNTRLPIGTTGQVLAVVGGVPAWATTADQTPLTTKGDLFTFDTADARLPVGTNGHTLVADSSTATGLKWAAPAGGGYWTSLASGSLSGSTLTLSSISGSYKDLRLIFRNMQLTTPTEPALRCNNDSASNYTGLRYIGEASTAVTYSSNSQTQVGFGYNNVKATTTTTIIFNLMDYANTTSYKIITGNSYYQSSATSNNEQAIIQSTWRSSSAINRLDFILTTGSFTAGTYELLGGN